jgi:Exopolysaccharide synthesis, ExoD
MSHEGAHVPTSVVLEELFRDPPPDYVMIAWLIGSLHKRSFGLVMLLIALVGLVPGMSVFIGILPRISSASNDFRARKPKPRAFHCPAPHAHAENRSLGASNHPIAKAPGDHHPSAVAHSVRHRQRGAGS